MTTEQIKEAAFKDELEKISARLSTEAREHIAKKNFAEPGKEKYPIEDKNHARNALARVSAFGSPAEKAEVRAKVHAKYPEIGKKSELADICDAALEDELQKIAKEHLTTGETIAAGLGGGSIYPFMAAHKAKKGHKLGAFGTTIATTSAGAMAGSVLGNAIAKKHILEAANQGKVGKAMALGMIPMAGIVGGSIGGAYLGKNMIAKHAK